MRLSVVVLSLILCGPLGCGNSTTQVRKTEIYIASQEVEEVTHELRKTLEVLTTTYVPARFSAIAVCRDTDYEEILCIKLYETLDDSGDALVRAEKHVNAYYRTGTNFETARNSVTAATNEIRRLIKALRALGKRPGEDGLLGQ